jgi:ATP-binding protein involved in chromosome partitioning
MDEISEADVRRFLLEQDGAGGVPALDSAELLRIDMEGRWIAITIVEGGTAAGGGAGTGRVVTPGDVAPRLDGATVRRVYRRMRDAFPDADVEVRAGTGMYCGGVGFGEGKHVLAVLGGKGGVGKSTIAVNLALTLSAMGLSVGLVDGDLNGPDIPHMLGISPGESRRPPPIRQGITTPPSGRRRPHQRYGVEVVSVGLDVPERFPPVISSRLLVSALLRTFIFDVAWTADVLVIDAPPGTGEELQVLARELSLWGVLFVTTPQDLAQMDAERTLTLMAQNGVPVIGMVQNMASLTCPHCEHEIDMYGFSTRLRDAGVGVLGRIPFDVQLSVTADQGRPLVLGDPRGPIAYEFARIGVAVRRWLGARDEAPAPG